MQNKIRETSASNITDAEIQSLNSKRNDQLFFSLIAYIIIIVLCLFFWKSNNISYNLDNKSFRINFSKSETEAFQQAVPYICILIISVATIFFIRFLRQTILPLSRDIKKGIKLLVYFTPERSAKKINDIYYLDIPFLKSQQLELTKEEYEKIGNKEELCLEITPNAMRFLSLNKNNYVIKRF